MKTFFIGKSDPEMAAAIAGELDRQRNSIELIASENFTSLAVMDAVGSVLTNKYAEGYPGKRYYGGCEQVDIAEELARERACRLFGSQFANVQPHSGAQANEAAYAALIKPGDKVLGMSLAHGGHLSHGAKFNFSGKLYDFSAYGVEPDTEVLDMDHIREIAREVKPALIVAGASAYPRQLDFQAFADIAHEVGAKLMVDMAHIAGLVAANEHPSPVPYADIVTSTSHKTMRGPRGGFMVTNDEEVFKAYNKAVFPGTQGGPLMHVIAGKGVAFGEALKPSFKAYAHQVVLNAAALGRGMTEAGLRLVSGGTDNHLCLVDLTPVDVTGAAAETVLESVGITVNKNSIPNEFRSSMETSGIRVGSAAMTTRGFSVEDAYLIGTLIGRTVKNIGNELALAQISAQVDDLLDAHPLYADLG